MSFMSDVGFVDSMACVMRAFNCAASDGLCF